MTMSPGMRSAARAARVELGSDSGTTTTGISVAPAIAISSGIAVSTGGQDSFGADDLAPEDHLMRGIEIGLAILAFAAAFLLALVR